MTTKAAAKRKSEVKTARPMKVVGKKYSSVSELVRDTSSAEFVEDFDRYQANRQLVNCLAILRCADGVSQVDLAKRMGCAQSKISKMESSTDADLSFGDVIRFALALNQSIQIVFSPSTKNGTDQIRFHLECIKNQLDHLARIAGDGKDISHGVEGFAIQTVQSLVATIESVLDKLPHRVEQSSASVRVEAEGEGGQRLRLDAPGNLRQRARNQLPA